MLENIAGIPESLESFIGIIICIGAGSLPTCLVTWLKKEDKESA